MKVIIDISEDENYKYATASDILLPDNATNGDIQIALYHPYQTVIEREKGYSYMLIYLTKEDYADDNWQAMFDLDWWNAPYKED